MQLATLPHDVCEKLALCRDKKRYAPRRRAVAAAKCPETATSGARRHRGVPAATANMHNSKETTNAGDTDTNTKVSLIRCGLDAVNRLCDPAS